ncbi:MAG: YdeI/OmpD-associated family protein [Opitutus sp.]
MNVTFFRTAPQFRRWLERHHADSSELQVGFYRKDADRVGLTYAEAVDEALCFGWIDGVVRKLDEVSYTHRFTPRKLRSIWSLTNVRHVERLTQADKMHPAGRKAFAARTAKATGVYAFEQPAQSLPSEYEKAFRANRDAWTFFNAQAPWYRRLIAHKIVTAKQEATRLRWLQRAIDESAAGRRIS